jgi:hypothetical protein
MEGNTSTLQWANFLPELFILHNCLARAFRPSIVAYAEEIQIQVDYRRLDSMCNNQLFYTLTTEACEHRGVKITYTAFPGGHRQAR